MDPVLADVTVNGTVFFSCLLAALLALVIYALVTGSWRRP
jgi:hypothetical protein